MLLYDLSMRLRSPDRIRQHLITDLTDIIMLMS